MNGEARLGPTSHDKNLMCIFFKFTQKIHKKNLSFKFFSIRQSANGMGRIIFKPSGTFRKRHLKVDLETWTFLFCFLTYFYSHLWLSFLRGSLSSHIYLHFCTSCNDIFLTFLHSRWWCFIIPFSIEFH